MELELPVIETVADAYAALTAASHREIPVDSFWYVEKRCLALGLDPEAITAAVRRVKTPEGAEHFNQPIGSIIIDKSYIRGAKKLVTGIAVGDTITKPDGKRETRLKIRSVKVGKDYVSGEALDTRTGDVEKYKLPIRTSAGRAATTQLWDEVESGVKAKISTPAQQRRVDKGDSRADKSGFVTYDATNKIPESSITHEDLDKYHEVDHTYPDGKKGKLWTTGEKGDVGLTPEMMQQLRKKAGKRTTPKKKFDKVDKSGKRKIYSPSRKNMSEQLKKYQERHQKPTAPNNTLDRPPKKGDLVRTKMSYVDGPDGLAYARIERVGKRQGKPYYVVGSDSEVGTVWPEGSPTGRSADPVIVRDDTKGHATVIDGKLGGKNREGIYVRDPDKFAEQVATEWDDTDKSTFLTETAHLVDPAFHRSAGSDDPAADVAYYESLRKVVIDAGGVPWQTANTYSGMPLTSQMRLRDAMAEVPAWAPPESEWPSGEDLGVPGGDVAPTGRPGWYVVADTENADDPADAAEFYARPDGYGLGEYSGGGGGYYISDTKGEFVAKLSDDARHDATKAMKEADKYLGEVGSDKQLLRQYRTADDLDTAVALQEELQRRGYMFLTGERIVHSSDKTKVVNPEQANYRAPRGIGPMDDSPPIPTPEERMMSLEDIASREREDAAGDITLTEATEANAELGENTEARQIYNEARAQGASHEDALDAADGFDKSGPKKPKDPFASRSTEDLQAQLDKINEQVNQGGTADNPTLWRTRRALMDEIRSRTVKRVPYDAVKHLQSKNDVKPGDRVWVESNGDGETWEVEGATVLGIDGGSGDGYDEIIVELDSGGRSEVDYWHVGKAYDENAGKLGKGYNSNVTPPPNPKATEGDTSADDQQLRHDQELAAVEGTLETLLEDLDSKNRGGPVEQDIEEAYQNIRQLRTLELTDQQIEDAKRDIVNRLKNARGYLLHKDDAMDAAIALLDDNGDPADTQLRNQLEYYGVPADRMEEVLMAVKEYLEFNPEIDIAALVEAYLDLDDGLISSAEPDSLLARFVSAVEREKLADKGDALHDGSFPIANKSDLSNAIQAYGRAKNKKKAKKHIKARAAALGATDMLPESWSK